MDDLLKEFLTETSENLAVLDVELVRLEQNPNDMDLLGNIFRLVHTVKGTCGFLGLSRLESVAHAGENVLGKVRDGEIEVGAEAVSLILECLDRIRTVMTDLEATGSEPAGDDTDLIKRLNAFADSGGVWGLASMFISMADHGGTHIDAPRHFGPSGIPIDQYPLQKCIVPGICLDLTHIAPRAEITPDDLKAAVAKAGVAVPKGGTVLLCTGHHAKTFPRKEYSSDNSGVNVLATEWLAGQGIVHFGIDSMRPGPDGRVNLLVHKACLDLDITHIESLCNLEALLGQGAFTFIGLPMKMREGTASPIRAVAVFGL